MNTPAKQERIALIHATTVAIQPIARAFKNLWPEAQTTNLLEDSLTYDLERAGGITPAIVERIRRLTDYAVLSGATGVLFTCSAFCDAIFEVAKDYEIPVHAPNDAMFEASLGAGSTIGLLATFAPAVEPMTQEFYALANTRGARVKLESVCAPEALLAARAGDIERHNQLVVEAAPQLAHCDAIMLAQFSTSTALSAVQEIMTIPVFSAPESAVELMRRRLAARR